MIIRGNWPTKQKGYILTFFAAFHARPKLRIAFRFDQEPFFENHNISWNRWYININVVNDISAPMIKFRENFHVKRRLFRFQVTFRAMKLIFRHSKICEFCAFIKIFAIFDRFRSKILPFGQDRNHSKYFVEFEIDIFEMWDFDCAFSVSFLRKIVVFESKTGIFC